MKKIIVMFIFLAMVITTGCNDQTNARNWGGETSLDLPKGYKLMNMTWKEDSIWYLVRPMKDGEMAEEYLFKENSAFGVYQGTVKVKEYAK